MLLIPWGRSGPSLGVNERNTYNIFSIEEISCSQQDRDYMCGQSRKQKHRREPRASQSWRGV